MRGWLKYPHMGFVRFIVRRFKGWTDVMREEFGQLTWKQRMYLAKDILKALITGRRISRREFFHKMRGCGGCIVYDKAMKRCRPYTGHGAGCGCYMPYKVIFGGKWWADENGLSDEGVGWGD